MLIDLMLQSATPITSYPHPLHADSFCFGICNTQWEVLLSKQVNYNQVVVKCQILQECFLRNFNMQKFHNMEHSNSRTFQGLLRTYSVFKDFEGPGFFFPKFKDFQGLLKDPMNPVVLCLLRPTWSSGCGQFCSNVAGFGDSEQQTTCEKLSCDVNISLCQFVAGLQTAPILDKPSSLFTRILAASAQRNGYVALGVTKHCTSRTGPIYSDILH